MMAEMNNKKLKTFKLQRVQVGDCVGGLFRRAELNNRAGLVLLLAADFQADHITEQRHQTHHLLAGGKTREPNITFLNLKLKMFK